MHRLAETVETDTERSSAAAILVPSRSERLGSFRSLGGNCEFGFVQRYGGVEPSGLFRFSYVPIADLIHALDTDFAAYGTPGDLRVEVAGTGTYYCRSHRYNIWSNTARGVGTIDPDALLEREYGRAAHLKGRMLEELAAGSMILVRKAGQGETEADFDRLAAAIGRHGPSALLRVSEAGPGWRPEPVRRIGERVYAGSVRRFAPTETAWDVDLEPWLTLCDSAYAVRHGVPEAGLGPVAPEPVMSLDARLRRHRGRHRRHRLNTYTRAVEEAVVDPGKVYVFSTWVWIPEGSAASAIFAVIGHERLGSVGADLALRGTWQRVWAAGRFWPNDACAPVGLGMVGSWRDRCWSWGASLHEGVVPPPAEPPPIVPEPAAARWLSLWRERMTARDRRVAGRDRCARPGSGLRERSDATESAARIGD